MLAEWNTRLKYQFHVGGEAAKLSNVPRSQALCLIELLALRKPKSNECETDNLRRVGLGGSDRKFSATINKDSTVVFTSQRAVYFVHYVDAL